MLKVSNEKYNFDYARNYWQNIPKAKGSNPWNSKLLELISDEELLIQFESEQKIARQKKEREMGEYDRPRWLDTASVGRERCCLHR